MYLNQEPAKRASLVVNIKNSLRTAETFERSFKIPALLAVNLLILGIINYYNHETEYTHASTLKRKFKQTLRNLKENVKI